MAGEDQSMRCGGERAVEGGTERVKGKQRPGLGRGIVDSVGRIVAASLTSDHDDSAVGGHQFDIVG